MSPPDVLRKLALENSAELNKILAMNPSTPEDILEKLAEDKKLYQYLLVNSTVQELARDNRDEETKIPIERIVDGLDATGPRPFEQQKQEPRQ